jgi:hypothetical protein
VQVGTEHQSFLRLSGERFPFILHVACAECCKDDKSPSALLNEQYRLLTEEIDPALHDALVRIAKMIEQADAASSQADRDKLSRDMEFIRSEAFPLSVQSK